MQAIEPRWAELLGGKKKYLCICISCMANLLLNWKCLRTLPFLSRLFDASSVSFTFIFISISFQVVIAWCSVTPHHTYSSYYFIIMLHEKIHVFLVSCTNYKYANKIIFFWKARQCKSNKISAQLVQRVEDAQMDILC